jgi:hypothetical protein
MKLKLAGALFIVMVIAFGIAMHFRTVNMTPVGQIVTPFGIYNATKMYKTPDGVTHAEGKRISQGRIQPPSGYASDETEEVEDAQILTIYFKTPLITDVPVLLTLDKKEYYKNDTLNVKVDNRANFNITFQGSDCSIFFERKVDKTWEIFAGAPGNYNEITAVLKPGGTCKTKIPLRFLSAGKYRAVFLGNALLDGQIATVKSYAEFIVY